MTTFVLAGSALAGKRRARSVGSSSRATACWCANGDRAAVLHRGQPGRAGRVPLRSLYLTWKTARCAPTASARRSTGATRFPAAWRPRDCGTCTRCSTRRRCGWPAVRVQPGVRAHHPVPRPVRRPDGQPGARARGAVPRELVTYPGSPPRSSSQDAVHAGRPAHPVGAQPPLPRAAGESVLAGHVEPGETLEECAARAGGARRPGSRSATSATSAASRGRSLISDDRLPRDHACGEICRRMASGRGALARADELPKISPSHTIARQFDRRVFVARVHGLKVGRLYTGHRCWVTEVPGTWTRRPAWTPTPGT